ncbi:protein unc-93 homolog A [Lingula anatina]|uniref:Protein unc-93 homolog A n=1 Tax=Lingula anatina TaxID=7574 RepID=A0A1S3HWV2_LINAN|nr:protein unc-93 homolog A [Lingula anatina]|eukprot:XP_013390510.1 protein unc-93 homolog A [Lingula anatina]
MAPDIGLEKTDDSEKTLLLVTPEKHKKSKWRPFSQLIIFAFIYMIGYSPLAALWNLEGILFPDVGLYALMCYYGGSLFIFVASPFITRAIGAKGSVLLGWFGQGVFIAAHFFEEAYVLMPVAVIVGIAHAQAIVTTGVFVTDLALQYSAITGQNQHDILGLFNGIYCMLYYLCGVWSNLISSLVLYQSETTGNTTVAKENLSELCGAAFCPWEDVSGTYITQPEQSIVYILLGSFLGMSAFAFIVTLVFLENVHPTSGDNIHSIKEFFSTVVRLVWKKRMLLILPAIVFYIVGQVFISTEYTKVRDPSSFSTFHII